MSLPRPTDRFLVDLLDIDSLPREVRPVFLGWARALEEYAERPEGGGGTVDPEEFTARVRLEAARRHALRVCQDEHLDRVPRLHDLMVFLSWNPDGEKDDSPSAPTERPIEAAPPVPDGAPSRPGRPSARR